MRWTINRMHRALGKLVEAGLKRQPVCVSKTSFVHNLEGDGGTIMEVSGLGMQRITMLDDDGGTKYNSDGTESSKSVLLLVGDRAANSAGEVLMDELGPTVHLVSSPGEELRESLTEAVTLLAKHVERLSPLAVTIRQKEEIAHLCNRIKYFKHVLAVVHKSHSKR